MKNFALGQYLPYNSFIHRLDARNKIFCLIVLMVAIFYSYSTWEMTFLMGGTLFAFILVLMIISHVSFRKLFSSLKAMWLLIIFLLIVNCLVPISKDGPVAFYLGSLPIYYDAIFQSLRIILRLIMMLSLTMVLTATTKPLDLTYALEWYLTPLKIIKFPAHIIAMIISLALRLIPTLLLETEDIMKAQASRGVDFKRGGLKMKIKAIISLIVPLFISSFKRSDELADAMSARGYNPHAKRTRYRKLHFRLSDLFVFLLSSSMMAGVICVSYFNLTIETPTFLAWFFICLYGIIFIMILSGLIDAKLEERKA